MFVNDGANELSINRSILSITVESRLNALVWLVGTGWEMVVIGSRAGRTMGCSHLDNLLKPNKGMVGIVLMDVICFSPVKNRSVCKHFRINNLYVDKQSDNSILDRRSSVCRNNKTTRDNMIQNKDIYIQYAWACYICAYKTKCVHIYCIVDKWRSIIYMGEYS